MRDRSEFSHPLGNIDVLPSKKIFPIDVKSFDPFPWRVTLFWTEADRTKYANVKIIATIVNTGSFPITVWQLTGRGPGDSKQQVIAPGKSEEVFKGSVTDFIGLNPEIMFPNLSIWLEDGKRIMCELKIEIAGEQLSEPLGVGLTRTEPLL